MTVNNMLRTFTRTGALSCVALLALALSGCERDSAAGSDSDSATATTGQAEQASASTGKAETAEAHTELRDAIREPQDRALDVQAQVDAAAKAQREKIAQAEGN